MRQVLKVMTALGMAFAAAPLPAIALQAQAPQAQAIVKPLPPPNAAPACSPQPEWDQALALNHQDTNALLKRGQAHADKGEVDCAITDFSAVLALAAPDDKANAGVLMLRSAAYNSKGKTDLAIADLTEVIRLTPDSAAPFYNRGTMLFNKGSFAEAIQDFTAASTLDPQNAQALLGRGSAFARQGNSAGAIADFTHALEINPGSALAYLYLGLVYADSDTGQAIANFNRAVEIDPALFAAYIGRARVYASLGQFDPALADYNRALGITPGSAGAYIGRGSVYRARGDLSQALADLTKATALDPKNANGLYNLGLTRYFLKRYADALKAFAKSADLTTNPNAKFYPAFWAYVAKAKLGFNGKTILARVMAQMSPTVWPAPIAALYQGNIAAADLPAKATDSNPEKQAGQLCEAYFYQGKWYLMYGQQDQATVAFKAAIATNQVNRPEYQAARLELTALGETAGLTPPLNRP